MVEPQVLITWCESEPLAVFYFCVIGSRDFPVPLSWDTHTHTHTHTHTKHPCVHLRDCLICSACMLSYVGLFATPWTVAHQVPLFLEFRRQEYCSELPFPPPGHLPDPGIKLKSLTSPALAGGFFTIFTTRATWEASEISIMKKIKWSGMTVIEAGKGGQHSVLISV